MEPNKFVTYSPYTRKFYIGNKKDTDFTNDENLEPIFSINWGKKMGEGRYNILNAELYRDAERKIKAGIVDAPSVTTITTTDLLEQVLNQQWRAFFAINGTTRMAIPRLALDTVTGTKYAASKKVPELVEAGLKQEDFTKVSFALWKNVVHVAASDEASLKANIEPFQYNIGQAAGALAKAANDQIVVEIEAFTDVAGADWGSINATHGMSDNDPAADIQGAFTTISDKDYMPDTITLHPKVWSEYMSNTFVHGIATVTDRQLAGVFPLPGWPQLTAVVDSGFTNTLVNVYDRKIMMLGEGPTVAEQYRNVAAGYNAWIIRQWLEPKNLDTSNGGRTITGVQA